MGDLLLGDLLLCVTIKKYNVNKPLYNQNRLFTAKENEDLKQVAYVNHTLNEFKELSQILGDFVFVDKIVSLSNALWCFICFLIEIQLIQNYFFSLKCTFRTIISDEKSDKTYNLTEIDIKHWHFISYFFFYCLKNYKKFDLIKVFLKKIM